MTRPLALVTGASGGIGADIARELAARGHDLILVARSQNAMQELAHRIRIDHGIVPEIVAADLLNEASADTCLQAVRKTGRTLDVLVNNAGFGLFAEFKDAALADEQAMLQLNILSLHRLSKTLLPDLMARRGRMLNVASTAAFQPGPFMASYYASKAFVLSFSEALAEELKPHGVSVSCLCPGPTRTGFQSRAAMEGSGLLRLPMQSASAVAKAGVDGMLKGKRVIVPGWFNQMMVQSIRFTPRSLVTKIVKQLSAMR